MIVNNIGNIIVDAAGDIAVLKVPGLTTQSFLNWGNSRTYTRGSPLAIVGAPLDVDINSIATGVMRNNQFVYGTPFSPIECILTDIASYAGNSGSPILDINGNVVGILEFGFLINSVPILLTGGPSQYMAEQIVNRMIAGTNVVSQKDLSGIERVTMG